MDSQGAKDVQRFEVVEVLSFKIYTASQLKFKSSLIM